MSSPPDAIDAALKEIETARKLLGKVATAQVRSNEAIIALRSMAYAWFKTHRADVLTAIDDVGEVDKPYQIVLDSTSRFASKNTYLAALKTAKAALVGLRGLVLVALSAPPSTSVGETPPDFSPLVGGEDMRQVLTRRWEECRKCVEAEAHLAAIVMMGGLLEALFVARANKLADKKPLINAGSAPKDKEGKVVNYQDWMLDSYIKVGHELKWITSSAKQVADVLKEFRNYVHPAKELRHGVSFAHNDSSMFWEVTKALVRQLVASVPT